MYGHSPDLQREAVRCPSCRLNQFMTLSGDCRRCHKSFIALSDPSAELKAKQDAMKIRWHFSKGPLTPGLRDDGFTKSLGPRITQSSQIRVQFESGIRRQKQTMCEQCIKGKHSLCASRSCPCVCNDSDFGLHSVQPEQALAAHG